MRIGECNGNGGEKEGEVKYKAESMVILFPPVIIFSPFSTNMHLSEASLPPLFLTFLPSSYSRVSSTCLKIDRVDSSGMACNRENSVYNQVPRCTSQPCHLL